MAPLSLAGMRRTLPFLVATIALVATATVAEAWTGADASYNARDNQGGSGGPLNVYAAASAQSGWLCPGGVNNDDAATGNLVGGTLPSFDFSFYGTPVTDLRAVSNGYLTTGGATTDYTPDNIPSATAPNGLIAPWWTDLTPDGGGSGTVCARLEGTGGDEVFMVRWNNVEQFGGFPDERISAQAHLFEFGDVIEFHYAPSTAYYNARAGIENNAGTVGIQYKTHPTGTGGYTPSNEGVQFRPKDSFPVAGDDTYTLDYKLNSVFNADGACGSANQKALCNDRQLGNVAVTAVSPSAVAPGSQTFSFGTDGAFTFEPPMADPCNRANGGAPYTFTYHIDDAFPDAPGPDPVDVAQVSITVVNCNDAPIAVDDAFETFRDTVLVEATACEPTGTQGVLCNDDDPDDQPMSPLNVTLVSATSDGVLVLNHAGNGSFRYTPDAGFVGTDSFTYLVTDGDATDTATVTITVKPVLDFATGPRFDMWWGTNHTLTATDLDAVYPGGPASSIVYTLGTPTNGDVYRGTSELLAPGATFTHQEVLDGDIRFQADRTTGEAQIPVSVRAGAQPQLQATGTLEIGIIDPPPMIVANASPMGVAAGESRAVQTATIEATYTPSTPAQIIYRLVQAPTQGQLELSGTTLNVGDMFTQADIDAGLVSYDALAAPIGTTDSFRVSIRSHDHLRTSLQTIDVSILDPTAPDARFTHPAAPWLTGTSIAFTDTSIAGTADITSWFWDFDDGSTSSQRDPTKIFADARTYKVRLTVTALDGRFDTVEKILDVKDFAMPRADFAPSKQIAYVDQSIRFTDIAQEGSYPIVYTKWDFDDALLPGEVVENPTSAPHRPFSRAGTYQVGLLVRDSQGNEDTKTLAITIEDVPAEKSKIVSTRAPTSTPETLVRPVADAGTNISAFEGVLVKLDGTSSRSGDGSPLQYLWQQVDGPRISLYGTTSSMAMFAAPQVGAQPQEYVFSLTVWDRLGQARTDYVWVEVDRNPDLDLPAGAAPSAAYTFKVDGQKVRFTPARTDVLYAWDFGDGNASAEARPVHTYKDGGTYAVALTVRDAFGRQSVTIQELSVETPPDHDAKALDQKAVKAGISPWVASGILVGLAALAGAGSILLLRTRR